MCVFAGGPAGRGDEVSEVEEARWEEDGVRGWRRRKTRWVYVLLASVDKRRPTLWLPHEEGNEWVVNIAHPHGRSALVQINEKGEEGGSGKVIIMVCALKKERERET